MSQRIDEQSGMRARHAKQHLLSFGGGMQVNDSLVTSIAKASDELVFGERVYKIASGCLMQRHPSRQSVDTQPLAACDLRQRPKLRARDPADAPHFAVVRTGGAEDRPKALQCLEFRATSHAIDRKGDASSSTAVTGAYLRAADGSALADVNGERLFEPASSVKIILAVTALLAVWVPAQRASTLDPMKALRTE